MKKILLFLVAAILAVTAACAGAEETGILDQLKGQVFTFSSGVGGWSNELTFGKTVPSRGTITTARWGRPARAIRTDPFTDAYTMDN